MPSALPLDPATFIPRFDAAARRAGFGGEKFGEIHGFDLNAYTKPARPDAPRIYVSSGMHGDEPAPPWAVLRLVEDGFFDARAAWWICPVLNPTGLARGTRENFAGIDLNRDYKHPVTAEIGAHVAWLERQPDFDAAFCLHEDFEAAGFYLYELNPANRPTLADVALAGAGRHCPIENAAVIDGRDADAPGIIRPVSDPLLRDRWPEAIYLRHGRTTLGYTFESPTRLPLEQRVAAHCAALHDALARLLAS
ncbi:MAG: M14 family metallocarboxypeptidase [Candidatus Didemnitutus sp.]|nr:M14 family metallocarboxypeptidase [Candidatus Didemnitutus sp.]